MNMTTIKLADLDKPEAGDKWIRTGMTTDEWIAEVLRGCIAHAEHLPEDVRPTDLVSGENATGTMLHLSWRWNGGRYGRKFAVPTAPADHIRNEATAAYCSFATMAQWVETCAELKARAEGANAA